MGIFNKIGDAVSDASRNMNEKTKNLSDTGNLKRKIIYEEERILEIFSDIGRTYYKTPENIDELKAYCEDIDTRKRRIKKMKFELQSLKGVKVCPEMPVGGNGQIPVLRRLRRKASRIRRGFRLIFNKNIPFCQKS